MADKIQKIGVSVKYGGKSYSLSIEAYQSSVVSAVIDTVEKGLNTSTGISFTTTKWGLELAPIWNRNYADHVDIAHLLELSKYPLQLNLILI